MKLFRARFAFRKFRIHPGDAVSYDAQQGRLIIARSVPVGPEEVADLLPYLEVEASGSPHPPFASLVPYPQVLPGLN